MNSLRERALAVLEACILIGPGLPSNVAVIEAGTVTNMTRAELAAMLVARWPQDASRALADMADTTRRWAVAVEGDRFEWFYYVPRGVPSALPN